MAISKELEQEIEHEFRIERVIRKRDQAYELASLAAHDGDDADCESRFEEATAWSNRLKFLKDF